MSKIKVIKTEEDYIEAINLVETLMNNNPTPDSEDGEKLDILSTLIADYESKIIPKELPSPIDAIKFRMEQLGLKAIDLAPYIGSRSRVSEILSGKRSLTLDMIRSLESNLGIPAKVLISKKSNDQFDYKNWGKDLLKEMKSRGYFSNLASKIEDSVSLLKEFFEQTGPSLQFTGMLRQTDSYRLSPLTDKKALASWACFVFIKSKEIQMQKKYTNGLIDINFMRDVLKLSIQDNGPILAQEYLKNNGIKLIIEPHFQRTYLDGATILIDKNNPVIGLTLRYDRLDNFWFTLMHELAHISLHYDLNTEIFYDELYDNVSEINENEKEADKLAEEAILPEATWNSSPAKILPSKMTIDNLAKKLQINSVIIAGQIRYKSKKYSFLSDLINNSKIRNQFPEKKWN